jgi:hypothetical protein
MRINMNFVFGFLMAIILSILLKGLLGIHLSWWQGILLFFISYPWTIKGNVYSMWGGFSKNSIYSLVGVAQVADQDANCLAGLTLCQISGGNSAHYVGIVFFQKAGKNALQCFGAVFFQESVKQSTQVIGIAVYQKAAEETFHFVGIIGYQFSKEEASSGVGLVVFQRAKITFQFMGVTLFVRASVKDTSTFASINFSKFITKEG